MEVVMLLAIVDQVIWDRLFENLLNISENSELPLS